MLPRSGWLLARLRAPSRGAHQFQIALGDAFVIALLATFLLNILVAYKGYLQHGLYAGWQPRYFLFAVPATWFIMTLVKPAPLIRVAILGAFAIAACISFWSSAPLCLPSIRQDRRQKQERKSDVKGKSVQVRVSLGGRGIIK